MNRPATTTGHERAVMERHEVVRTAADLLFRRDLGLPRDVVRTHVVNMLLDSVHKQERWSR